MHDIITIVPYETFRKCEISCIPNKICVILDKLWIKQWGSGFILRIHCKGKTEEKG